MDCLELRLPRHTRRESVEVHLVRIGALGFEKERMTLPVREGYEFCLYRRTVAWSGTLYLPVEER